MENWFGDEQFAGAFRGGPRAGRGDLSPIVLQLLKEKPMHGYEIIRKLEERSHGFWRPSAGSIYPVLQLLEEQEYVTSHEEEKKKVYALTEAGRAAADQEPLTHHPWQSFLEKKQRVHQFKGTFIACRQLMLTLRQIAWEADEKNIKAAHHIIAEAAEKLEKLKKPTS